MKKSTENNSIRCNLFFIKNTNLPIIGVELKYYGHTSLSIDWDENFGNVLWMGNFVLVNEKNGISKDNTESLYMKTGNTYKAEKNIKLNLGDELNSTLDFSKLPISLENNLISKKNSILKLYYNYKDKNGIEKLQPISNELILK